MTRLNLILFFVLLFTALGSVTAQHKSRKLYFELQQQQDAAKQFDIEWGQLQLEQSTWAMHARIEYVAAQQLHMQVPDSKRIQVVVPSADAAAQNGSVQNIDKPGLDKPVSMPARPVSATVGTTVGTQVGNVLMPSATTTSPVLEAASKAAVQAP